MNGLSAVKGLLLVMIAAGAMCCASAPAPNVSSIDFGKVLVGDTSAPHEVYWGGDEAPVPPIDGVSTLPPFSITSPIPYPPPRFKPRAHGVISWRKVMWTPWISIVFTPTAAGNFDGEAVPQSLSGKPTSALPLHLSGVGVLRVTAASAYLQSGAIDFGDIVVGSTASRTLTVTNPNSDEQALRMTFNSPASPFSATAAATAPRPLDLLRVQAGQSYTLILQFAPKAVGPATDILEAIDAHDHAVHLKITLTGRAHAPVG